MTAPLRVFKDATNPYGAQWIVQGAMNGATFRTWEGAMYFALRLIKRVYA